MGLTFLQNIPLEVGLGDDPYQTNYSFFYAVHNPIVLNFQRKDFTIASIADDGSGNAIITFNTPNAVKLALAENGQSIYIDAHNADSSVVYKGVFTIITTDATVYIAIDTPFIGDAAVSSFLNLNDALIGYYCDIAIYREDSSLLQTARYVPLPDGSLSADIAGFVRRLAAIIDTHDYDPDTLLERDTHLCTAIIVKFRERFNDESSALSYVTIPAAEFGQIYWVNAAKQIGDIYGSNMALYVPFPDTTGWNAKFLTLFDQLIFYRGYPMELALIISDRLLATYAANLTLLIQPTPGFLEPGIDISPTNPGVYRINIDEADIGAGVQYLTVSLISHGITQQQWSEAKRINLQDCAQNSIYLKWINTLGGWSYWMFEFDQTKAIAVTEAKTFEQTITDLATAESRLEYLSKRAFPKMTIGADGVTAQIMKGLKGILYSPKVMWLTNPDTWNDVYETGAKWQTVLVDPGSFTLESTREGFANVEITIEFVELNIQTQ